MKELLFAIAAGIGFPVAILLTIIFSREIDAEIMKLTTRSPEILGGGLLMLSVLGIIWYARKQWKQMQDQNLLPGDEHHDEGKQPDED